MPAVLQVSTLTAFSSLPHRSSSYAGDVKLPLVLQLSKPRQHTEQHFPPRSPLYLHMGSLCLFSSFFLGRRDSTSQLLKIRALILSDTHGSSELESLHVPSPMGQG